MRSGMSPSTMVGALFVIVSALGFSLYPVFGKYVFAGGADLATILFVRFAISAVLFWLVVLWQDGFPRLKLRTWLILWGLGGIGYAAQSGLYLSSVRYIPASLAALLLYAYPLVVTVLTILTKQEKLSGAKLAGLLFSSLGLISVLGLSLAGINFFGVMLALGAALVYSVYIIIGNQVLKEVPPLTSAAIIATGAALSYGVFGWTRGFTWDLSTQTWLGIGGIILFSTVLAMLTFFLGMQRVGAATASILSMLEPVLTVFFAFLLFNESFSFWQGIGACLVISGGILAVWTPRVRSSNAKTVSG